jgi:hypothetical protein
MSNIAFDLEVFQLVANAVPVPGSAKAASLGAIGPDLYQYVPISVELSKKLNEAVDKAVQSLTPAQIQALTPPPVDLTPIKNDPPLALELFQKPLMAAYSILFGKIVVPFWPIFQRDADLLNQLQTAANNQDGDALKNLADQTNTLTADADQLKNLVPAILGVTAAILQLVALPPAIEATSPQAKPWFPQTNRLFEFLRWHHTDAFARNLVQLADTQDKKAYAYGHLCHVAASVTGKPFINNIVGGPYRTHWWRNRLVSNFVDAWTFGRYETPATMSGDTPSLPYAAWGNICTANLQDRFNISGLSVPAGGIPDAVNAVATGDLAALPAQFPADMADYVQAAIDATYPTASRPPGFSAEVIKDAFVGLFAVVWFMTSGFGPMTPFDLGPAPASCTTPPSWVTGGGSPPSPQQSGPSTGATVCGVLLAILALVLFLFQNWAGGAAAVVGAIAAFASGGSIDWDQLQCNLFWLRKGLLDAGNALVDGLVKAGLAYPAPAKLGTVDANGVTHPAVDMTPNFGMPLTKSNSSDLAGVAGPVPYPHQLDTTNSGFADLNFAAFPPSAVETPQTTNLPLPPCYAERVIDGSGLQNGGMLVDGVFPSTNKFFGDAVANAQQLIADQAQKLPPYNLDADRGYGWKAWTPQIGTFPGSGQVNNPKEEL